MIIPVRRVVPLCNNNVGYRLAWDNDFMPRDKFVGMGIINVAKRLKDIKCADNDKSGWIAEIAACIADDTGARKDEFGYWWWTLNEVLQAGLKVSMALNKFNGIPNSFTDFVKDKIKMRPRKND